VRLARSQVETSRSELDHRLDLLAIQAVVPAQHIVEAGIRRMQDYAMANGGQRLMSDEGPVHIRSAAIDDVEVLALLSGELGYPATSTQLGGRLQSLLMREHDHAVFVATVEEAIVGWIHVGLRRVLEVDDRAEILGLVVSSQVRQRGVGRALVAAAESWAAHVGLSEVVVRSNVARAESHPFYERLGYTRTKTQHVYLKIVRRT
jgi:GNAT superfamily N-acetyltransferase